MTINELTPTGRVMLSLHGATINLVAMMAEGTPYEAAAVALSDAMEEVARSLGMGMKP